METKLKKNCLPEGIQTQVTQTRTSSLFFLFDILALTNIWCDIAPRSHITSRGGGDGQSHDRQKPPSTEEQLHSRYPAPHKKPCKTSTRGWPASRSQAHAHIHVTSERKEHTPSKRAVMSRWAFLTLARRKARSPSGRPKSSKKQSCKNITEAIPRK